MKEIVDRVAEKHKIRSNDFTEEGDYKFAEYENGTYIMGYNQCLIDIYNELKNK